MIDANRLSNVDKGKNKVQGGWVAKLLAPLCYRQHSEFEFRHPSKIINGRHKQRSGQHTIARKKDIQKSSTEMEASRPKPLMA